MTRYSWTRHGRGYECSSKGDTRFSALYAYLPDGRTIEQHYQCDVKGYDLDGTNWRLGKGRSALNPSTDLWTDYLLLWMRWSVHNLPLLDELRALATPFNGVLKDSFATTPVNQAHALATILNGPFYEETVVVNTKRGEPFDVDIRRPSCWGNPYVIGVHGAREEVIALYERDVRSNTAFMLKIKTELKGKRLGCGCKPKACHGDVLADIANGS